MCTIKINSFFKISKIAVFLLLLLFLNPPQYVMAEWHWGIEDCNQNAYPEGLVGGFFFQFENGWTDEATCKFEGWNQERDLQTAWCYLGSITTILLYHEWPKESHFSGNWGSDEIQIDHVWKYADIKNLSGGIENWYQDDPENREISGCTITGSCSAADEIRRLYGAVRVALGLGGNDEHGCVFAAETTCIPDALKKLGYQLEAIEVCEDDIVYLTREDKQKLIDSLKNGYPIIVVGSGHVWVLDDYRNDNGGEFHILNDSCSLTSHSGTWTLDPTYDGIWNYAQAFIYNIRPKEEFVKWEKGDVFVGGVGMLKVYDNSGVFKEKLDIPQLGLPIFGFNNMTDKLYITDWNNDKIYVYDGRSLHHIRQTIDTKSGVYHDCKHTNGIVFAVNGDFYVGHSEGRTPIQRFNSTGRFQSTYSVATEGREGGVDFLSLSADQKTMYYTSKGERIMRYNLVDKLQLTDFANIPGEPLRDLVLLPPDGKGGLIVAQSDEIKRLDINGKVVKSYSAPDINLWFTLALDPNGTSFWALSPSGGGKVCRFNIQSGKIEVGPINTMFSSSSPTTALCVKGAPIVSLPKKQIITPEKNIIKFVAIKNEPDEKPLKPPLESGTSIITAELTNMTDNLYVYAPIKAVVIVLEYKDYPSLPPDWIQLISATEGDGTVGSKQEIKVGPDDILMPHESVKVEFRIGLQQRSEFIFYVVVECFTF